MTQKTRVQEKKDIPAPTRSVKRALLLTVVSAGIVLLVLYFMFGQNATGNESANATTSNAETQSIKTELPETGRLIGRWIRPDGGYILQIRSATPDGKLDVGYYNPNTINVDRAEWTLKDDKLYVMVELKDVNYPGSTYGLEYNVSLDKLVGIYYQAQEKQTFDVEFEREK